MSIWQFNAAVKGYIRANSSSDPKKFNSEEEIDDVWNWLESKNTPTKKTLSSIMYIWDGSQFTIEKRVNFEVQ